jgi:UDP-N-acetylmuramoylalanine--D-glutamate ligase
MKLSVNNQLVLVLGLGDSGLSTLRWLHAQGAQLRVADSRETHANVDVIKAELPDADIHMGDFNAAIFEGVAFAVISPGVPLSTPAIQQAIANGLEVIGDVELFAQYRSADAKVIGITGSNGKTTVTTLVGEMCQAAGLKTIVAGNIGLPVLEALMMDTPDVYVLELSSFQLETTHTLQLDAATMLNVSEDHMDRYESYQDYVIAKARIFYNASCQVLNRDDAWSMMMTRPKLKQVTFGLSEVELAGNEGSGDLGLSKQQDDLWLSEAEKPLIALSSMKMTGLHNASNAMAAMALCREIGIDHAPMLQTLYAFKGLPHRVEWVANIDDVDYFDDSKGTNVGATCAAIAGMAQPVILIAGCDGKGQDFKPLVAPVKSNVNGVVLIGQDAHLIEAELLATEVPMYRALDLAEAVNIAKKIANVGDAVLLSPACASFDMFKNYIDRAEVYVAAVNRLKPVDDVKEAAW